MTSFDKNCFPRSQMFKFRNRKKLHGLSGEQGRLICAILPQQRFMGRCIVLVKEHFCICQSWPFLSKLFFRTAQQCCMIVSQWPTLYLPISLSSSVCSGGSMQKILPIAFNIALKCPYICLQSTVNKRATSCTQTFNVQFFMQVL